jgi:hypothetical protein
VACISPSIVAPFEDRSISIAVDCLVPDRMATCRSLFSDFLDVGRLRDEVVDAAATRFFADFAIGISLG